MPRGDGTGPDGIGPMTGRSAGFCAGYNVPGYANSVPRRGMRLGRGFRGRGMRLGRGFGFRSIPAYKETYNPEPVTLSKTEEKKLLQEDLKEIELEKKEIEKRLKELK